MVACAQCRQRKVRCQGGPISCDACTRLGFQCSMGLITAPSSETGSVPVPTAPRKRGARACDTCRSQRSRCSGETPSCSRCRQLSLQCGYTLSIRQYRGEERRRRRVSSTNASAPDLHDELEKSVHSMPTTGSDFVASPTTSASERLDRSLGCSRAVIRHHIDAYFEHVYPIPIFSFLHRADLLGQYASGTAATALLLAVCSVSSRFLSSAHESAIRVKSWVELAEIMGFQSLGKTSLATIQTLIILAQYHAQNHQNGKSFHYLALAVRMAYLLKLHKEDTNLTFLQQESRRRTIWCLFMLDRFYGGGVPEFILLPATTIQVQLPCLDRYFSLDMPVTTPHLHDEAETGSEQPISTFILRVLDIRNRVLQYTKRLLDTSSSPESSLAQFQAFEQELKVIEQCLPTEFAFSPRAYQLRAFSPERTTYIVLHLHFHHCHCELYRLLNPGYREALPQAIVSSISPDLVAYAHAKCLEHALSIAQIVTTTYELVENDLWVTDTACFVILYQASCAILYACHRDSPAYTMSAETARRYFVAFIATLQSLLRYFPRYTIYVNDIRNMLRSIDEPDAPLPAQKASVVVDFRARPVPSEESSDVDNAATQTSAVGVADTAGQISARVDETNTVPLRGVEGVSSHAALLDSNQYSMLSELGPDSYDMDFTADLNQGVLWDWADALGSGFNL